MSFICASTGKHISGKPARVITEIRRKTYPPRDTGKKNPKDDGGTGWEIVKEVNMTTRAAVVFCRSPAGKAIEEVTGRPSSSVVQPKMKLEIQTIFPDIKIPPTVKAPKI